MLRRGVRGRTGRAGATVHPLGAVRASRPWTAWRAGRRLADVPRAAGPTSRSCTPRGRPRSSAVPSRLDPAPLVRWTHAPGGGPWWQQALASRHRPAVVVCNSDYTRRRGRRPPPSASKSSTARSLHHVAQVGRDATRAGLGVGPDAVVVLMAARMESWKGHRLLLNALARLRDDPAWTCWIAGGGQNDAEASYRADAP